MREFSRKFGNRSRKFGEHSRKLEKLPRNFEEVKKIMVTPRTLKEHPRKFGDFLASYREFPKSSASLPANFDDEEEVDAMKIFSASSGLSDSFTGNLENFPVSLGNFLASTKSRELTRQFCLGSIPSVQ